MHEHILQSTRDHTEQQSYGGGHSDLNELFPLKSPVILPVHSAARTPDTDILPLKSMSVSPVLPGTGLFTHNVTRMLSQTDEPGRREGQVSSTATHSSKFSPYSTPHCLPYRQTTFQHNMDKPDDDNLEGREQLRGVDAAITDSSMTSQGSTSPHSSSSSSASSLSGSSRLSPESDTDVASSPETGFSSPKLESSSPENDIDTSPETSREDRKKKKLVRTCYTNEQIQTLLKMFHDNPYPDSEQMENIAQKFGVTDNKIKIWFQNKRARWRRRVNESVNSYPTGYMPMTPAMSSVIPLSYMTSGSMIAVSSPQHVTAGYFNPWMQNNAFNPNNNSSAQIPVNPAQSRLSPMTPSLSNQRYPSVTMTPENVSSFSPAPTPYSIRTSPQQVMASQFPSVTISPNNNSYLSSASLALAYPRSSQKTEMTPQVNPSYQYCGQAASGYSGYTNPRVVN